MKKKIYHLLRSLPIIGTLVEYTFEERTMFATKISIIQNLILSIGKIIFALITKSYFFFFAGIFNYSIGVAKKECYDGVNKNFVKTTDEEFKKINNKVASLIMLASIMYIIYMARHIFYPDAKPFHYNIYMSIVIAGVSFVEFSIAIGGMIKVKEKGLLYRNVKIMNFIMALTAIVMTQIAILSSLDSTNNVANGITGLVVGIVALVLSIFIYFSPSITLIDRDLNDFKFLSTKEDCIKTLKKQKTKYRIIIENDMLFILFFKSKIYGTYIYEAMISEREVVGKIFYHRKKFKYLKVYQRIIFILFIYILLPLYLIGRFFVYIKNMNLPHKLELLMNKSKMEKIDKKY